MASVVIGTTPIIKYEFRVVDVSDITIAYLTIKQNGVVKIEKDLNDAIIGESSISWRLSQRDTLGLKLGSVEYRLNYKLEDGTRGASKLGTFRLLDNDKKEVI